MSKYDPEKFVRVSGLANAPMSQGFTWAAWVKMRQPETFGTVLSKTTDVIDWKDGAVLWQNAFRYCFFAGGNYQQDSLRLNPYYFIWSHICCVYDPTNTSISIYVNGLPCGVRTNVAPYVANSAPLWIGTTFSPSLSQAWDGDIADVRLYSSVFSAADVLALIEFQNDSDSDGLSNREEYELGTEPMNADSDCDELNDGDEIVLGTDPFEPDTDGDGIFDGIEVLHNLDPLAAVADADGDGLTNMEENELGTSPVLPDTDGDTLSDGDEVSLKTNPLRSDSDGDGLADADELAFHSNPNLPDTDGDAVSDGEEAVLQSDPCDMDSDDDGLTDGEEYYTYLSGLTNVDTDADGLDDLFEVLHGLNPVSYQLDPDGDELSNFEERQYGTDPLRADTDRDGLPDGVEIAHFFSVSSYHEGALWFDVSSGTNLLAGLSAAEMDNGMVKAALPSSMSLGGRIRSEIAVSVNGVLWLLTPGQPNPTGVYKDNIDLSVNEVCQDHAFLAAFWDDLQAYPAELGSAITVASCEWNNLHYNVIEFRNMGFHGVAPTTNDMVSFQVVIPCEETNQLYVSFKSATGLGDGRSATLGFQGPGYLQRIVRCHNEQYSVMPGSLARYGLGTGTMALHPDTDMDGLTDGEEIALGTDPRGPDTDGDGFDDRWEVEYRDCGFDPLVPSDMNADYDGDGLSNLDEYQLGTNPGSRDSDNDGIEDADELVLGTNPVKADTDGDGLSDYDEISYCGTDPLQPDTDGDGLPDGWEHKYGMDPTTNNTTDSDPDNDPGADPEGDGLTNAEESVWGTNPFSYDTDLDGISDEGEVLQGYDPLDPEDTPESEWLTLTGDLEENEVKTLDRTFVIPAGQSRLIVVAAYSEEYPVYTGDSSKFNDRLTWDISPGTGASLSGSLNVNDRHSAWEEGVTLIGYTPVSVEGFKTFAAPPGEPMVVTVYLTAENVADGDFFSTIIVGVLPGVDLDMDSDYDADIDNDDDPVEESAGGMVAVSGICLAPVNLKAALESLGTGSLTLSASAGGEKIKVWPNNNTNGTPITLPKTWTVGSDSVPQTVYVQGVEASATPRDVSLKLSYSCKGVNCSDDVKLTVVRIAIVPDRNRDGIIEDADRSGTAANEIFRFWINDDKDVNDIASDGSDIPGKDRGNCTDAVVNGRCDLLDFFPVWLDLKKVMDVLPSEDGAIYRLRSRGLKFVYTGLTKDSAGSYLKEACGVCGVRLNQDAFEAETLPTDGNGETLTDLSPTFLSAVRVNGNRGVLMVEGVSSSASLELEVLSRYGDPLISARLPLSVSPVEEMFNRVNLRGGPAVVTPGTALPPDNGKHVIFLHGFRVDVDNARAWGSEMFKRFWQSGSNARLHSVTWYGDDGLISDGGLNYHANVVHAFEAAPHLKNYVNNISGVRITMAHSLGNMVVSSAIADHGMSVVKYFMLNAAVAAEAFDASEWCDSGSLNPLVSHLWAGYPNRTWSAKWHEYFLGYPSDDRNKLTWKKRFELVPASILYNYYSSGDEVLSIYESDPVKSMYVVHAFTGYEKGNFAWQKQERFKGRAGDDLVAGFAATDEAGWGFGNPSHIVWETDPSTGLTLPCSRPYYPDAAAAALAPLDQLRDIPVFKQEPPSMFADSISGESRNSHLARAIPALSGPVGSRPLGSSEKPMVRENINMTIVARPNGWGRTHAGYGTSWMHGDLKDMAYFYNFKVYGDVVEKGELK